MKSTKNQRSIMATDSEWERIVREAQAAGMGISRFIVQRVLMPDRLPPEVLCRAVREMLVLSTLEERRLCEAGAGKAWEVACDAVDDWLESEGALDLLSDPGTANRWRAVSDQGDDNIL